MASTERSLGWATGVAGTDGASAYDTARMIAMERNTLGTGVLLTGSYLAMSLTSASSILSIADGAAIVNGYFYESNGAVTIAAAGLAVGTYYIIVVANTTGGSLTVSANGAGTTTITTATTRAALATLAQYNSIITSVTSAGVLLLGTVYRNSSNFDALAPNISSIAKSRTIPNTQMAQMVVGSISFSVSNSTYQTLTGVSGATANSTDGTMVASSGSSITVPAGTYIVTGKVLWDSNTTGTRALTIIGDDAIWFGVAYGANSASAIVAIGGWQEFTTTIYTSTSTSINLQAWQNSGATRTITAAYFRAIKQ